MNETLLLGGILGLVVVVGVATLATAVRTLRSARRAERGGDERLEILREQQERLKLMNQERRMLEDELDRLRSAMGEEEERPRELPAPAEPEQPEQRSWWRRMFGG